MYVCTGAKARGLPIIGTFTVALLNKGEAVLKIRYHVLCFSENEEIYPKRVYFLSNFHVHITVLAPLQVGMLYRPTIGPPAKRHLNGGRWWAEKGTMGI